MESPYFPYGIYSYLLTGRDSGLISLDSEANEESTGVGGFKIG